MPGRIKFRLNPLLWWARQREWGCLLHRCERALVCWSGWIITHPEELQAIVVRAARILGIEIEEDAARVIAHRSRGTARIAGRLLSRSRDYAQARADGMITEEVADKALALLGVDARGLDDMDRRLLETLIDKFDGGPVGLNNLGAALSEETDTLEEVYEPYLIQEGLLVRTHRGRQATARAYLHLGKTPPEEGSQNTLF